MSDLRSRLRNLRAVTNRPTPRIENGDAWLPALEGEAQPLETLVPGDLHETPFGAAYVVREQHAPDHMHGQGMLDSWLTQSLAGAAVFTKDRRLAAIDPRRCLFLDTETTGLNAGVGTLVFLVGIGLFTESGFEVRQYFLRSPGEEPAMLHAIQA